MRKELKFDQNGPALSELLYYEFRNASLYNFWCQRLFVTWTNYANDNDIPYLKLRQLIRSKNSGDGLTLKSIPGAFQIQIQNHFIAIWNIKQLTITKCITYGT